MNYLIDHIARKGTTHTNCEDNALSFTKHGNIFGIVSDGCSSEKDSQFISSFLCSWFKGEIDNSQYGNFAVPLLERDSWKMGIRNIFATMIFTNYDIKSNTMRISFIGDGTFFIKFKDSDVTWYRIDFDNYPMYPEYTFDRFNFTSGITNIFDRKSIISSNINIQNESSFGVQIDQTGKYRANSLLPFYGQTDFIVSLDFFKSGLIDMLGFCSDGVDTFIDKNINPVSNEFIINELCNIKLRKENFLQRRFNIIEKNYKHTDDFSCVMFIKDNL